MRLERDAGKKMQGENLFFPRNLVYKRASCRRLFAFQTLDRLVYLMVPPGRRSFDAPILNGCDRDTHGTRERRSALEFAGKPPDG